MRKLLHVLIALVFFASCSTDTDKSEIPLVEGLPSIEALADSLNQANAKVAKWAVNDSSIVHSPVLSVDWTKELEAFIKTNVNFLRYRQSFHVTDTMIGSVRTVTFKARSEKQEVQLMEIHVVNNRIEYYEILKSRENMFSSSMQHFLLDRGTYTLKLVQKIPFLFSNEKLVVGTIIENGELWRGSLALSERELPFIFVLDGKEGGKLTVKNGMENVGFQFQEKRGNTWVYQSEYFNSRFEFAYENDSVISGQWINAKRDDDRVMKFRGELGNAQRFKAGSLPKVNLTGMHSAQFLDESGEVSDSTLLMISQVGHRVTGSFLTETGDYRYLDGVVRNDSLLLSSLDGTHAFMFEGKINASAINGVFFSGLTWKQQWQSTPNSKQSLVNPETMTRLKQDSIVSFAFHNAKGEMVSLDDSAYAGKAIAVTLMGTWCSNCLDEAMFLKEAHAKYKNEGFEVIALDFELTSDSAKAFQNIARHQQSLELNYPILLASLSSTKTKAAELLPFLSGFYSYPTLILLDRNHRVVKIHTGFSGPASGKMHYEVFRMNYLRLIDSLVHQPA